MRKRLFLILILTILFQSISAATFSYTQYSKIQFHELSDTGSGIFSNTTIAARIATLSIDGSSGYGDGVTGIRIKSNLPGNISIVGDKGLFGGLSNIVLYLAIQEEGGGTTYVKYDSANSTRDLITFTSGSTKSYTIDFYVIDGSLSSATYRKGSYYYLNEKTETSIELFERNNRGRTGDEFPVNGVTGGTDLISSSAVGSDNGSTFEEEDLPSTIVFSSIEDAPSKDSFNEKTIVEIAYINLWGENVKKEERVNVKFTFGPASNGFKLVNERNGSNIHIPYKMWANDEEVSENYTLINKPTITKDHVVSSPKYKAVIIKAKIDLTTNELLSFPAGSYTDTLYVEISLDL